VNNGIICVPVCAETGEEMIRQIQQAEKLADVVELRFDYLNKMDEQTLRRIFAYESQVPWLSTFRPKEQGGHRELTVEARTKFWNNGHETEFIDVEEDIASVTDKLPSSRICSHHDFSGVPDDVDAIFTRLSDTRSEIVKIAVNINDVTEAIPVWKLLERAKSENKQTIPIAMGEAGKWTRILGPLHGAFLTYASLESGSETAPGQISAVDMRDVYRVKELDEDTEVYGIIAGNTSYSTSPFMHNSAFKAKGVNAVFVPFQVKDLDAFMRLIVKPQTREIELNLRGFSVTNPHKQSIIKHLDGLEETAKKIGAVNTIKLDNEKLYGFNTDAFGFIEPLKKLYADLTDARVAVVGSGGAARAVVYSLKEEKTDVTIFARDPKKAASLVDEFNIGFQLLTTDNRLLTTGFDIIVNATPLGTRGEQENETIARAEHLGNTKLVYDLVYNPAETTLIREAKKAGVEAMNGLEMIVAQGMQQFKIWTGRDAPVKEMRDAVIKRLFS
jgi:3-dehydroquinate dehydratase/shikimate dehydrogenase